MEILELKEKLKREMTIDGVINKRYYHSLEVCKMALKLEEHYHFGVSKEKLAIAGILHDCAKLKSNDVLWKYLERTETKEAIEELKQFPQIWHSFVGKTVAKEDYHINDDDILSAIYYHTVGRPNMTKLEQIIFVSDYIEETRVGECFDKARKACFEDLDKGTLLILAQSVDYLEKNGKIIYSKTIDTYNYYLGKVKNND